MSAADLPQQGAGHPMIASQLVWEVRSSVAPSASTIIVNASIVSANCTPDDEPQRVLDTKAERIEGRLSSSRRRRMRCIHLPPG